MKKMLEKLMTLDSILLIVVFITSYAVSMYIQQSDPDTHMKRADYIIGFFASVIGGYIAYKFVSFTDENPGQVMFWTIVASVTSPRAFKFLVNPKTQERLINSIFDRITKTKKDNENV